MANHGDSQIGIQSPYVSLAQRDNVDLIERRNKGSGDPVHTCGFAGQAHLRRLGDGRRRR